MEKEVLIIYNKSRDLNKIKYVYDFIFTLPINRYNVSLSYVSLEDYKVMTDETIILNNTDESIGEVTFQLKNENIIQHIRTYTDILKINSQRFIYDDKLLFGISNKVEKQAINAIEGKVINIDIVSTLFFHLSRIEEYLCPEELKDEHERMKSSCQFLVRNKLERTPVIDEICFWFLKVLDLHQEIESLRIMSHDIDVLKKYPSFYKFTRGFARILFSKNEFKGSLIKFVNYYLKSLVKEPDIFNTFSWLINDTFFDKKIIFFMSGGVTKYDNFYKIRDDRLIEVFKDVESKGYEIGLHPSYATYNNFSQFSKEKAALEKVIQKKVVSSRQHILHYQVAKTPAILEENEILNDYTLGYQDRIGYRAGTGFDFYLWNNLKNENFKIKEVPLIIMDGCLLIESAYSVSRAKEIVKEFCQNNSRNTKITFNFHNSIFDPVLLNSKQLKELYLEL